ncbi:CII family transcriptional regulator [Alcanivoracaceae bacterium MT1]
MTSNFQYSRRRGQSSLCLQRFALMGQRWIADELGCHESTISRLKDGELERFCQSLGLLGLKIVPAEYRCARPELIEAAFVFAHEGLRQISEDRTPLWEYE